MESKKKRASAPVTPSCSPGCSPVAKYAAAPAAMDTNEIGAPAPVAQPTAGEDVAAVAQAEVPVEAVDGDAEVVPPKSLKRPAAEEGTNEADKSAAASSATVRKARRTMHQDPPPPPGPEPGTRACLVPMRQARDNLQALYESGSTSFYDIILRVGKHLRLPAHRFVLAAHSPFFAKMLSVQMAEQDLAEIQLVDVDEHALAAIVNSFYSASGTIALSAMNVSNVIRCASRLQTVSVERVAVNFFCNCLEPACGSAALNFATEMAATSSGPTKYLLQQCLSYVCEHFRLCSTQTGFLMLSHDTMRSLLMSDSLECDEMSIFNGLVAWVKHDEAQRSSLLEDLLPLIRFPQMLPADLSAVCAEPLLTSLPGGLLMPLLAECVPGAGNASCARMRPRAGSAKKVWKFSRVSTLTYGTAKGLSVLDRGAIVTTVDGGDGGTAWFVQNSR